LDDSPVDEQALILIDLLADLHLQSGHQIQSGGEPLVGILHDPFLCAFVGDVAGFGAGTTLSDLDTGLERVSTSQEIAQRHRLLLLSSHHLDLALDEWIL